MLLTVRELAQLLRIKASTLYAWAAQGKLPCVKLNGLIRFRREDIDQWIESCQRTPTPGNGQLITPRSLSSDVDTLIARAKAQAYTPRPRGNQTEIKPHREGGA